MKKWLHKILVITVALLTFGLITPTHQIWGALENGQPSRTQNVTYKELSDTENISNEIITTDETYEEQVDEPSIDLILLTAKEQSYIKFGSRIAPVIGTEFEQVIFPKMQEAIEMTLAQIDADSVRYLAITDKPSGQYAEKIFNITDGLNGKDLIRFHVRTENRPFEGYYYNFHYHTFQDQFALHHNLGEIYWSKNTPPKWLS